MLEVIKILLPLLPDLLECFSKMPDEERAALVRLARSKGGEELFAKLAENATDEEIMGG